MAPNIVKLFAGFCMLYFGSEFLVRGGVNIALSLRIKKLIIGLTLCAFGTSSPEFVVSFLAGLNKSYDVCIGNVVGSNISNIFLVLGIAAIIRPIKIDNQLLKIDFPVFLITVGFFVAICFSGEITRITGSMMLVFLLLYLLLLMKNGREEEIGDSAVSGIKKRKTAWDSAVAVTGLAVLIAGGDFTVRGAVGIADAFNISKLFIGLTVVAIGTSLPELFASSVASYRRHGDISIGNVLGSNIFNICFVLGVVSLFFPLSVPKDVIRFDNWCLLAGSLFVGLIAYKKRKIGRREGIFLLLLYVIFIFCIYVRASG
ncbi:MAG: calcium/sodium antiporter [Candidatus Aureabacteria bacterium]|nr:calcium/sodium antiporter [Candidatus Auribacterota bacterium]